MEHCDIFYTVSEHKWDIKVPIFEFSVHLNRILKNLKKNEQVNLIVFSLEEPIKERCGTVYKDITNVKLFYNQAPDIYVSDMLIYFKDGSISLKSILGKLPSELVFYDLNSLEDFSRMKTEHKYSSVDITIVTDVLRRICIQKEVTDDA